MGVEMREGFERMGVEMREGFERMGTEMHEGFAEMREEFKHMNQTLETLPERIARAFKDMK